MKYQTIIEKDGDDAVITIPDEIITILDLKEGDEVVWEMLNGKISFRKKNP